ncbi:MAG TPA: hypothetical protein PKC30_13820 [Saprospiraceae bacterium]|nr:hypothetical protein [Saprospiraceae bacterium]
MNYGHTHPRNHWGAWGQTKLMTSTHDHLFEAILKDSGEESEHYFLDDDALK